MSAYADTGVLVSLHVQDALSQEVARLFRVRRRLVLTPLHRVEFANALALGVFHGRWTPEQAAAVDAAFQLVAASSSFELRAWPEAAWSRAAALSRAHSPRIGVRSLDALHVAAAELLGVREFLSFDRRQRSLAAAAGLVVRPARLG